MYWTHPLFNGRLAGKYYIFEGNVNEVVALYSDGNFAEVVRVYLNPDRNIYVTILGGQSVDGHNSNIEYGAVDDNRNWVFEPEEHFIPTRGKLTACKETLKAYDLEVDDYPEDDATAAYFGSDVLSIGGDLQLELPERYAPLEDEPGLKML